MSIEPTTEAIGYNCGSCGGNNWSLRLGHRTDGKTILLVTCANPQCVQELIEATGATSNSLVVWEEFDITGQGYDAQDLKEELLDPSEVN